MIPPRAERRMVKIAGWSSQVARQAHNPALRDRSLKSYSRNPLKPVLEDSDFRSSGRVMKRYQVYMIENECGRRYIGLSEDVRKRLSDHNDGVSKWTAKYRPWRLVWTSGELDLSAARKLENLLKRQKGGAGLAPLLDRHLGSLSPLAPPQLRIPEND